MGITTVTKRQPVTHATTNRATKTAQQGRVGNRKVSTSDGAALSPIREQVDKSAVTTQTSERAVSLVPDDPMLVPISWFTDRLPAGTGRAGKQDSFQLVFGSELLDNDMHNVVNFAQKIDHDIVRASELLEKSEHTPLNKQEQGEVNGLLRAGKYNLAQVQRWTSVVRDEFKGLPTIHDFIIKLQERLADRHMDLADLMCLYDIDQSPPEHAVSRTDRIDYNLITADAAIKVAGGLTASGLSVEAKQQLVEVLEEHRAGLLMAKDFALGGSGDSDSLQVLPESVWNSFDLTKGKKTGDSIVALQQHWADKAAGTTTDSWLPLAHPELTQEQMLLEFTSYQLKQAGVAEKDMPNLKFEFKNATNRTRNELPWEPIDKELHYYSVEGELLTAHSKITPAKDMAGHFAKDIPANGVCCGDRMQYTHVPNLARTELIDDNGETMFSALRHGVLDAYDISASNLRKLPEQELSTMVKDLLVTRNTKNDSTSPLAPRFEDEVGRTASHGASTNPTVELAYGDSDYATVKKQRTPVPEVPAQYNDEAWESTLKPNATLDVDTPQDEYAVQPHSADIDLDYQTQQQMRKIASESPYEDIDFNDGKFASDGSANANPAEELTYGNGDYATVKSELPPDLPPLYSDDVLESMFNPDTALDAEREQQVSQIVDEIRTSSSKAKKYASEMRTAASHNMAKELAVATLVSDPDKLQSALDGKITDINLSSISLLTPDRIRPIFSPDSNEHAMLRQQTAALQKLNGVIDLQVRDAAGELRTVQVNCKVRTFNFGVNAGAVGRAKHIPSHTRGWDKLMGWGYAMEKNNPELQSLFGKRESLEMGGEVYLKLMELGGEVSEMEVALKLLEDGVFTTDGNTAATISDLESEIDATLQHMDTLRSASVEAKQIWREGSYNKGGQDPYKMVSRLGVIINEMGETLAFNCKSGKDRTGQLDAELKYLAARNDAGYSLPKLGATITPDERQMRSDFTLNSGNLEMQRMNTGLPGFKLNIKEVPGLANFIAGPELEPIYHGGSKYISS